MSDRKLVVLGIPWEIETDGLKDYMSKFGDIEDCIVMKDRSSGRSRGFGYVTFVTAEDAKNVLDGEHFLGNRMLEVKIATPKEEMRAPARKVTRIFVARIPPSVTETVFRSHFEKYGEITDLYMPKDPSTKGHRGIGFITFATAESVDDLMVETHDLGGSAVVVDRATPKEDDFRPVSRMSQGGGGGYSSGYSSGGGGGYGSGGGGYGSGGGGYSSGGGGYGSSGGGGGYGAYNAYISAATRYAALGAPTLYDHPSSLYGGRGGSGGGGSQSSRGMGKKIFVGRLPQEATSDDLRQYFGRFGRILDVYVPKDPKRSGHRGFGFVTFEEDGVAERVSRRTHEICGQQVAIDSATPLDGAGGSIGGGGSSAGSSASYSSASYMDGGVEPFVGYGGPIRTYGRMYGSLDFDDWGYGMGSGLGGGLGGGGSRASRSEYRYRPY
ncbi:heterogeneous nuclear ribonucleoprotein A1 [Impatiens glandulifera]|uniref:heterogeneous nuclear ribonucleoprotein A1 n=1 Tax=Impatiens glandulifera TaxID=253017 RepID=UPI001FB08441|nr:heterogeneous nuclear ribonucleoprotein A1 [Impatiens glandulifera]